MDRGSLETFLTRGLSLAEIGRRTGRHESTIAYWVEKYGLRAVGSDRHRRRGPLERRELELLVAAGASIAEIADRVGRSKASVRHWLTRYGLRTTNHAGRRPARSGEAARGAGLATARLTCRHHGETDFWLDGGGIYRCKRCRAEAVSRRRRKVKAILVSEAGGACQQCGYSGSPRALHFHHLDPSKKRLQISAKGVSLGIATLRAEVEKCVLLCANCHAEVEDQAGAIDRSGQA
jgi:transposase